MTAAWMALAADVVAAFALAFAGWVAFSRTMERHALPAGRHRGVLRGAGAAGLVLSLLACRQAQGSSQGWVLWCGVLTLTAMALMLVLTYAPQRAGRAGWVAAAVGVAAALEGLSSP